MKVWLILGLVGLTQAARKLKPRRETVRWLENEFGRKSRQAGEFNAVGIDFTDAVFDEEAGKRCILKTEEVQSIEKRPVLECTHKETEQCHYTYITKFKPYQEEVCEENFEKQCQITFKSQAVNETVRKCYKPIVKVCNGEGETICKTIFETSCTTKYIEKQPGKFVGDTSCEKLPIEICGAGCSAQEGPEECHQKVVASIVDVPEEVCDLNPQKLCRLQTKLVPQLVPKHECSRVPRQVCNLKYKPPRRIKKPLITKWCLDESPVVPGKLYSEGQPEAERTALKLARPVDDITQSLLSRVPDISVPGTNAVNQLLPLPVKNRPDSPKVQSVPLPQDDLDALQPAPIKPLLPPVDTADIFVPPPEQFQPFSPPVDTPDLSPPPPQFQPLRPPASKQPPSRQSSKFRPPPGNSRPLLPPMVHPPPPRSSIDNPPLLPPVKPQIFKAQENQPLLPPIKSQFPEGPTSSDIFPLPDPNLTSGTSSTVPPPTTSRRTLPATSSELPPLTEDLSPARVTSPVIPPPNTDPVPPAVDSKMVLFPEEDEDDVFPDRIEVTSRFPIELTSRFPIEVTDPELSVDSLLDNSIEVSGEVNFLDDFVLREDEVPPTSDQIDEDSLDNRSIAILSSSEDDYEFYTNFKTQEFADFVDFSNFNV